MAKVTYLIAHTPRVGSNWLCEVLANTGLAGIGHVNRAGLFIGYGEGIKNDYPDNLNRYFADGTTPNGVCGMKSDWHYMDGLARHLGDDAVIELLERYTHFIWLKRDDVVAQAVSLWIAAWSGVYTSKNAGLPGKKDPTQVPYDAAQIIKRHFRIDDENRRWGNWFNQMGIRPLELSYEYMHMTMEGTIIDVFTHLGVGRPENIATEFSLRLQENPLKQQFIDRFKEERGIDEPPEKQIEVEFTDEEVHQFHAIASQAHPGDNYDEWTMTQLRTELSARNLEVKSRKKSVLVDALRDANGDT